MESNQRQATTPVARRPGPCRRRSAFSLVEVMVAMAILAVLLLVTVGIVNHTQTVWVKTVGMTSAFREARSAFDNMTRRISQATLNTYFDYVDASGKTRAQTGALFTPDEFVRQSELHLVSGQARDLLSGVSTIPADAELPGHAIFFQAPLGFTEAQPTGDAQLTNLLNAVGYFVQYSDDSQWKPSFLPASLSQRRYRLMQMIQASERLSIYDQPLDSDNAYDWFRTSLNNNPVLARPVANNIIALVVWPRSSEEMVNDRSNADGISPLTDNYAYDTKGYLSNSSQTLSRNQLPPQVQITLVALEEASAQRLEDLPASEKALLAPGALFNASAPAAQHREDLVRLVDFLNENSLRHRVFTTNVTIRQAKFSNN